MNYLAHIYLSGKNDEIKLGNFIADAVKGTHYMNYSKDIQTGILLHRKIDTFTDQHPIPKQSRDRIRHIYGKHSGIVIDIFYDHFLAANWQKYSDENYSKFIKDFYWNLFVNYPILPSRIKYAFPFMVLNNWLNQYKTIVGTENILTRMSIRTSLPDFTKLAIEELNKNYKFYERDFFEFFEELRKFVRENN